MPIGYEDQQGCCLRSQCIDSGHWYASPGGSLYIVPTQGEIEGPDDEITDQLNTAYRRIGFDDVCQLTLAVELGLTVIHPWQQRFDNVKGYFAA